MGLYQDYRPEKFDDMIGNEGTIESLISKLNDENRPHVYLFNGEKGCGKTTAARIMAKELGAEGLSIREINGASNRGINDAREIISQMNYAPIHGDVTVFIIDECHKTTSEWQNSMLKPLEDTPEHVYFFLCTTEPQKLLKTVKSRCSDFNFKPLNEKEMFKLLRRVAYQEGLEFSKEILYQVIDVSEGSPRMGLVNLEKIKNVTDEKKIEEILTSITDDDNPQVRELCQALLKESWSDVADVLKSLKEVDEETIRYMVMGYMNSILLKGKNNPRAAIVLEYFSEPFYNSRKPGLTLACYQSLFSE